MYILHNKMEFITAEQIIAHREGRKKSGLLGCITGEDTPLYSLKGMTWRPADPMNPSCFCHDCRTTWDSDGSIDLELIKAGNERALFVYASLLPSKKDIYRDLRSKTDDSLEDFVKAQMALFAKMKELKDLDDKISSKEHAHDYMTSGKPYGYLKANETEIDLLEMEIRRLKMFKMHYEKDASELEAKCRKTETALSEARKAERDFIDKIL